MTTLAGQIKDAGRKLRAADAVMYAAIEAGDHEAFERAFVIRNDANNYHNALLVSQIEQRDEAMRLRISRCT